MPIGGSAVLLGARALAARIRAAAAALLEADADDVVLADARAAVRGSPDRGVAFRDLARVVHFRSNELRGVEPSLEATVHFANPAAWTFTNGAHLAMVEVDGDTGTVEVRRYIAVDDCGRIVNPALVDGQIAGGIVQGLGGALWERCVYDGAGQLVTGTLMDYAVPRADQVPGFELHHLETPAPALPGGFKGAGEAGATGAPAAVLNAVNDALAPAGASVTEQPVTPERVWRAMRDASRGG
jgi:carbon-monoxide dehydrogenase large subunit